MSRRVKTWVDWRRLLVAAVAGALLLAAGVAALRADLVARLLHPERYAVSGAVLLPADAYVRASRGALGRGERVSGLTFPEGLGPVTVSIVTKRGAEVARTVYLDPPSGRVLAIVARDSSALSASAGRDVAPSPLARPAQSVASVIVRARSVGGGEVRRVAWPTTRSPDWTVELAGRAARRIKVADDSGSARPALVRDQGEIAGAGGAWPIVASGVGVVVALAVVLRVRRRRRRRSTRR